MQLGGFGGETAVRPICQGQIKSRARSTAQSRDPSAMVVSPSCCADASMDLPLIHVSRERVDATVSQPKSVEIRFSTTGNVGESVGSSYPADSSEEHGEASFEAQDRHKVLTTKEGSGFGENFRCVHVNREQTRHQVALLWRHPER